MAEVSDLILAESYEFDVNVTFEGALYHGKLSLSPSSINLKIVGESRGGDQRLDIFSRKLPELTCKDVSSTYLLLNLKLKRGTKRSLERESRRSYVELDYEVACVARIPRSMGALTNFSGLAVRSPAISAWLGDTHKQVDIADAYSSGSVISSANEDFFTEFCVDIECGKLAVVYTPNEFYAPHDFKVGLVFPPSLHIYLREEVSAKEMLQTTRKLLALMNFFMTADIEVEKINWASEGLIRPILASIYFPTYRSNGSDRSQPVYPLGRRVRFHNKNLPELPLKAFSSYFDGKGPSRYFEKYVSCRRLISIEERFLGYYRLLEALTAKKSVYVDEKKLALLLSRAKPFLVRYFGDKKGVTDFLRRLPKFNSMKYNTEKCFGDFFSVMPVSETCKWWFKKRDFASICKLRNDISHANEQSFDANSVAAFTAVLDVLLVVALLQKIEIPVEHASKIIPRLSAYRRVLARPDL